MPNFKKMISYFKKTFVSNELFSLFDFKPKHKHFNQSQVLFCFIVSFITGLDSLNTFSQGSGANFSRSVLEGFLQQEGLPRKLRQYLVSMIKRMKRGKMIQLENIKGKIVASVDGVEVQRKKYTPRKFFQLVEKDFFDTHCQIAIHRVKGSEEIEYFEVYKRIIVVTIITKRGPFPIGWAYQQSTSGQQYYNWIKSDDDSKKMPSTGEKTEDKLKQEGELTTLKSLLISMKKDYGKLPFDVLIGDGIYDKAPIIEAVEQHNIFLVSVLKDERRILKQLAKDDFSTTKAHMVWEENKRSYDGWGKVYKDENINRTNQNVKIIRVFRHEENQSIDNYFYCSNRSFISPRFVEWCRFYRWKEENGFNSWTNIWHILKHEFHHSFSASDSIISLFFISIILVDNYRFGNLNRGERPKHLSLKLFFREIIRTIPFCSRAEFFRFHHKFMLTA